MGEQVLFKILELVQVSRERPHLDHGPFTKVDVRDSCWVRCTIDECTDPSSPPT